MTSQSHVEVELKLRVPPMAVDAVEAALRAVDGSPAVDIDLDALYHDTDDWQLSAAGFAWRMRREGDRWVQTLKTRLPGADPSIRLEHEVDVGPVIDLNTPPSIDAGRHAEVEWGVPLAAMVADLGAHGRSPRPQFRVVVHRVERTVTNEHGRVALALDRGHITAGAPLDDRPTATLEVCELEIELVDGEREAVAVEAARWADRFGLVADLANKARRGRALADSTRPHRRRVGGTGPAR